MAQSIQISSEESSSDSDENVFFGTRTRLKSACDLPQPAKYGSEEDSSEKECSADVPDEGSKEYNNKNIDDVVYVATTGSVNGEDKNIDPNQKRVDSGLLEPDTLKRIQLRESTALVDEVVEICSSTGSIDGKQKDIGAKELDIENKSKKRANAALEKQAKKQKLAEEKAAKKTVNDMNKIYKPGECMKYMNIEGHSSLWARWYMSDVEREVGAAGARLLHADSLCHPALLVWTRTLPRTLHAGSGQVKLSPSQEPCDRALYIASMEELSELVNSHTLATHLSQIQQMCDCKLSLLVFKTTDYFKSTRRKASNSNRTPMTEIEFELAITDLLVSAGCDTSIANTPNDLALHIVQFTKAIAEAPFKKAKRVCDEQAEFYMRGDNKKCVAIDKDGVGVGRLWQQMIAILPQSSLETSRALCAKYKSPLALYQALQSSDSIAEVADIGVSRAAVAGSRARRIGPEFARKLHTLFTAHRGDMLVD